MIIHINILTYKSNKIYVAIEYNHHGCINSSLNIVSNSLKSNPSPALSNFANKALTDFIILSAFEELSFIYYSYSLVFLFSFFDV